MAVLHIYMQMDRADVAGLVTPHQRSTDGSGSLDNTYSSDDYRYD